MAIRLDEKAELDVEELAGDDTVTLVKAGSGAVRRTRVRDLAVAVQSFFDRDPVSLTASLARMVLHAIGPFALALSAQADAAGGVTGSFSVTARKDFGTCTVTASEALAGTPGLSDITMEVDA